MSEKSLKMALIGLATLVAAYLVVVLLPRGGGAGSDGSDLARHLATLSPDGLTSVSIRGPDRSLELTRDESGAWRVNGFETDSAATARFWNALESLDVRNLVASNPDNHERLGVAEDSAWAITFAPTGGDELRVLMGKTGPSFTSAYMRLPEADAVYLVEGGLRSAATRRVDDWRDRTIATVDTAAVWTVTATRDGSEATIARSEDGWTAGEAAADSATVAALLTELSGLEASGFAADSVAFDGDERRSIVAMSETGDTLLAVELAGTDGSFIARATGGDVIYQLPAWRADRVVPTAEELRGEASDPAG